MAPNLTSHDPTQARAAAWLPAWSAFLRERMAHPFEWGVHDCCLFAADAWRAMHGRDPAADVRGTYSSAIGAARVLQALGGLEAVGARAGAECAPLAARLGDVGLVSDGEAQMLGVCTGAVWLVPKQAGLGALPLNAALRAWRASDG